MMKWNQYISGAESTLRDKLYNGEQWIADYRRLRIVATKRQAAPEKY